MKRQASGCRWPRRTGWQVAAALLAALAPSPAAQAAGTPRYECTRPALPDIPIGEDASREALAAARVAIEAYLDAMQGYVDCLKRESDDAIGESDDLLDRWESSLRAFEARSGG